MAQKIYQERFQFLVGGNLVIDTLLPAQNPKEFATFLCEFRRQICDMFYPVENRFLYPWWVRVDNTSNHFGQLYFYKDLEIRHWIATDAEVEDYLDDEFIDNIVWI